MRIPLSVKLVLATWIAALLGALAGRSLAEVASDASGAGAQGHGRSGHAMVATSFEAH